MLFLLTTAEESVSHPGADYFAAHPTVPRRSIVANVNIDAAPGTLFHHSHIVAHGAEHSTLDTSVREAARRVGYEVNPDPYPEETVFMRGDNYSFVKHGIPAFSSSPDSRAAAPRRREGAAEAFYASFRKALRGKTPDPHI